MIFNIKKTMEEAAQKINEQSYDSCLVAVIMSHDIVDKLETENKDKSDAYAATYECGSYEFQFGKVIFTPGDVKTTCRKYREFKKERKFKKERMVKERCQNCISLEEQEGKWFCNEAGNYCDCVCHCPENL